MGNPTIFRDDTAISNREAEVINASFVNGMNLGGSCACGLGINMGEGAVVGTPEQFTLLDQHENARTAQISQSIGGFPYMDFANDYPHSGGTQGTLPDAVIFEVVNPTQDAKDIDPALDGTATVIGNATLADIAVGWVPV